jgi:hypothetical protein
MRNSTIDVCLNAFALLQTTTKTVYPVCVIEIGNLLQTLTSHREIDPKHTEYVEERSKHFP